MNMSTESATTVAAKQWLVWADHTARVGETTKTVRHHISQVAIARCINQACNR